MTGPNDAPDSAAPTVETEGAILWFDRPNGQGALETDDGRHLRFVARRFPFEPEVGRKVLVRLNPTATSMEGQVQVQPLPDGRREVVAVEEVQVVQAKGVDGLEVVRRPIGVEAPRIIRDDPAPFETTAGSARRRGPRRKYPARREGEAFAKGASVRHPVFGQGFVQVSTTRVARVRFGSQERQVRVAELTSLS
jgi:hypothetical protein